MATTKQQSQKILMASMVGTMIEYFDFYIYSTAAVLVFPKLFFPMSSPTAATLESLATFALAFFARPLELHYLVTLVIASAEKQRW